MKRGLPPEGYPQDHGAVREASTVVSLLNVLEDATRLATLRCLRGGEHRVMEPAECLGLAQLIVSQHLAILRNVGLASDHPHGRVNVSQIESPEAIERVLTTAGSSATVIFADGMNRGEKPRWAPQPATSPAPIPATTPIVTRITTASGPHEVVSWSPYAC